MRNERRKEENRRNKINYTGKKTNDGIKMN